MMTGRASSLSMHPSPPRLRGSASALAGTADRLNRGKYGANEPFVAAPLLNFLSDNTLRGPPPDCCCGNHNTRAFLIQVKSVQ